MVQWVDKTKHYNDSEIRASEIRLGRFRITIHRHIDYPPDTWLATSPGLFGQMILASKDLDEAKCQAKARLQLILEDGLKNILEP